MIVHFYIQSNNPFLNQDVLYTIINDTIFDVMVTICIILNTVFLAIEHHGMSEDLKHVLDLGNKVRTCVGKGRD